MVNVEREAVWKERFNQWRESGLSQRAYALPLHGFPPRQVGYWVRRLNAEVSQQKLVPAVHVPVAMTGPALVLRSPGGWTIDVPSGLPPATLTELLRCPP